MNERTHGMVRTSLVALTALLMLTALGPAAEKEPPGGGKWVCISDGVLEELGKKKIKIAWPGKTTGVVADRTTGDVYMIVTGQGVWKSSDRGGTFRRMDGKVVGGRCETGYALCMDPAGKRLACFMLDGRSGRTDDGGKTWTAVKNVQRGYDWAAVDWSGKTVKTIFALVHESGGIGAVSRDGGKSWKQVGKRYLAVGVFGADVLVCGKEKTQGIFRSTDGGGQWTQVDEATPIGAMVLFGGTGYWLTNKGLMTSKDRGKTWVHSADVAGAAWGPYFGKDAKHFVVINRKGFRETPDAGKTWKVIAPYPPSVKREFNRRGWFLNFAWDPIGRVCYVSRMGQGTWKFQAAAVGKP